MIFVDLVEIKKWGRATKNETRIEYIKNDSNDFPQFRKKKKKKLLHGFIELISRLQQKHLWKS